MSEIFNDTLNELLEKYQAEIEAAVEEWCKIHPIEDMILVSDHLPKGVPYLQHFRLANIDERWLVLRSVIEEHSGLGIGTVSVLSK